ncbi:hypothetical protein BGZ94_005815, partial [Podila epigama]
MSNNDKDENKDNASIHRVDPTIAAPAPAPAPATTATGVTEPGSSTEAAIPDEQQPQQQQLSKGDPLTTGDNPKTVITRTTTTSSRHKKQSFITKALLSYLNFFRVVQPLASIASLGTISPVLAYFQTQTLFPAIQASLYVYTASLATCSLLFSLIYLVDVFYRKPLFWPFTNKHFRRTSKARIGGDMIICILFCGLWFLSLIGLLIDTLYVDCSKVSGLSVVILKNREPSLTKIKTICYLERATFGLAAISWCCWMGVLLVLIYGHFWKRRQVIAERLKERLARRHRRQRRQEEKDKGKQPGAGG